MIPERNIRNTQEALRHMAGVRVVDRAAEEAGGPHQHTTLMMGDGEKKPETTPSDTSDPWAEQRTTKSDESTDTLEIGGEPEIATDKEVALTLTSETAPPDLRSVKRGASTNPLPAKKLIEVLLETEQYSVELQVLGVEVNRPFLVLIHGEKPNFSPKGRCKFLAKIDGAQYSVDFLGIQFQIKSHGLYITTFLLEDKQSDTGSTGPA